MPDQEFEYDVFLSHASEDTAWCETLAERLRNEGVRVWFDQWEMQPGHHVLVKINDGIAKSRKMVAMWSANYFRDGKIWTLLESFSQQHGDPLSQDRPIIPLLIADCYIPPTFRNILSIDFRNQPDFDLRFRQLLQALDLPRREFTWDEQLDLRRSERFFIKRGRTAQKKGSHFENEIATIYKLLGFDVAQHVTRSGVEINMLIQQKVGGLLTQAIVECTDNYITQNEGKKIIALKKRAQQKLAKSPWIMVSSQGFSTEASSLLKKAEIVHISYRELIHELIPLDHYVEGLIAEYENEAEQKWRGEDWYIRPDLLTDVTYEKQPAINHFAKWLGSDRSNFLVLLGDLGTGKSTLARFLAYNLALSFRADPLRHPAPVLIPLKDVRKENTLESMIISHFSKAGLPGINFPRFEHLVRLGKIILLFDAFDEMADRVRCEVTKSNFTELRRAAEQNGKVILTCRTHYFKDRNEQAKLIGVGPRLSEIETDLYRELKQQSGAEVVYLREFDDAQIKAYLHKARPQTATTDWQKIQNIYNLKELAQRPLLLDMIVKSLPKLEAGQQINAASLYKIYTNIWIEREEAKSRILDKSVKMQLMHELAWRLWHETKDALHYRELVPFVEKLAAGKVIEFGDEEADDIAREMQAATFLKRDDAGNFSFVHRSFMEYFLAHKIYDKINGAIFMSPVLSPHRTSTAKSSIYSLIAILPRLFGRRCSKFYARLMLRISPKMCYKFFTGAVAFAPIWKRQTCYDRLCSATFDRTILQETRADHTFFYQASFHAVDLNGVSLVSASLAEGDFSETNDGQSIFITADVRVARDLAGVVSPSHHDVKPVVQLGQPFNVTVVAYSPNGELLANSGGDWLTNFSGYGDGIIRIYRVSDGKLLQALEGHQYSVNSVHFSPDGEKLASGSDDNSVRLWEVKSGKLLRVLEGHENLVWSVHFSPDGEKLASGSLDKSVRLWEVKSGKLLRVLEGHEGCVWSVNFSPDGEKLASGGEGNSVRLWEVKNGKLLRVLEGHKSSVLSVHFSPDGEKLASGSLDKSVRLWEVKSGRLLRTLEGHEDSVWSVHFSLDGEKLASGSEDQSVRLWEVKSGRLLRMLKGHTDCVRSVHFSPNGEKLASGSLDKSVRLWEVKSDQLLRLLEGHQYSVNSVHLSPDGEKLASGNDDNSVRLWEVKSGKLLRVLEGHKNSVRSVYFSPDGEKLASGSDDNSVRLWEVKSGILLRTLKGHWHSVTSVHFSLNGKELASGSKDENVMLWDVKSGQLLRTLKHRFSVNSVHFSPDGEKLASGNDDNSVQLWEVKSGLQLEQEGYHQDRVNSVQFSPDGEKLVSGSEDHSVRLWEVKSGKLLWSLEGHTNWVRSVHFSPDGKKLASGSNDHTVRLWEVETGKCLQILEGHLGPVNTLCFSPNGKYLVAAGAAGRLQFWDFEKGETFLYRYAFGPGAWLDLLPDGRFDASPEGMRYLCYTEQGTLNSYTAEELVKEFYDPKAVQEALDKYVK